MCQAGDCVSSLQKFLFILAQKWVCRRAVFSRWEGHGAGKNSGVGNEVALELISWWDIPEAAGRHYV